MVAVREMRGGGKDGGIRRKEEESGGRMGVYVYVVFGWYVCAHN